MPDSNSSAIVYVTYQGSPGTRFDKAYYVEQHLPLVMQSWGDHGLESAVAYFPPIARTGTIAICECRFRDAAAIETAFASPQAAAVMADVAQFTDVAPARFRSIAL